MTGQSTAINLDHDVNVHFEDRRRSRIFFFFLWFLYAMVYLTKNCFNGALSDIVTQGLMTKSQTGLITGLFYLVYTPGQIVGGIVCDKVSPEKLIKFGLLGAALANAVIFFNQNYYVMLGAWMFNAVAQFALWPGVFKIITSQLVRSDRKQMIFGISFASTGGLILSYLLAAVVSDWRHNFSFSAVVLVVLAVALHLVCRWANPYLKWDPPAKIQPDAHHPGTHMSTGRLFARSGFYYVLLSTVLYVVVTQTCTSLTPIMLVESYPGVSPSTGNLLNITLLVTGIMGTLLANVFIIRRVKNHPTAMALTLLAALPLYLLSPMVGRIPVGAMVAVLCLMTCMANVNNLVRSNYTAIFVRYGKNGAAAGILNAGMSVSFMLAAYVFPRIQESLGWSNTLWSWPILAAVCIPLLLLAGRQYGKFSKL
ncbi:MAG: MFS transporter [Oscillospiraceae bacterium]|nr:MFS transporter [Oscillospiraceae bacterium]